MGVRPCGPLLFREGRFDSDDRGLAYGVTWTSALLKEIGTPLQLPDSVVLPCVTDAGTLSVQLTSPSDEVDST